MNGLLCGRQIELHQLLAHFFHRHAFGFVRLRMWCGLVEPRPGAAPELLGSERRDIHKKKPVRDGRSRLQRFFHCLGCFLYNGRFWFHNALDYKNLEWLRKRTSSAACVPFTVKPLTVNGLWSDLMLRR